MNTMSVALEQVDLTEYESIKMVNWFLGGNALREIGCGKFMLATLMSDRYQFSPLMILDELEEFCSMHMAKYQAHYEAHKNEIDCGVDVPPMRQFWATGL